MTRLDFEIANEGGKIGVDHYLRQISVMMSPFVECGQVFLLSQFVGQLKF